MRVLKGILKESQEYYKKIEKEIIKRLSSLPRGNIKKRKLNRQFYYYLQFRKDSRVIHKYLGKKKPAQIYEALKERKQLEKELKKVRNSLKLLRKVKKK